MSKTCAYCGGPFTKSWQRKYCSLSCSAKANNSGRRVSESTRRNIRAGILAFKKANPPPSKTYTCEKCGDQFHQTTKIRDGRRIHCSGCKRKVVRLKENIKSIKEVSKRTATKIFKRLGIGCSRCGWDVCVCDTHHIRGRNQGGGDEHENLSYLCPNCHRMAGEGMIMEFITLEEQIGNRWKALYGSVDR